MENKQKNENKIDNNKQYEVREFKGKTITVEIAAGAILGALSILLGWTWDYAVEGIMGGPSFAPGMSWFDLLAVPIIVAFYVFGIRSALIAAAIGCGFIATYVSDPVPWLSIFPKLTATLCMFLVPWIILKVVGNRQKKGPLARKLNLDYSSSSLKPGLNYTIMMIFSIFVRTAFMFLFNTFLYGPLFLYLATPQTYFPTLATDPELLLTLGAGYAAWNIVQGIGDAALSYLIVYPTNLAKRFSTWW
jgi:hypothetical protein